MKKPTQAQTNPFAFSDTNKRYHTYDYYLKQTFGGKVAKITLDGGFTCPNRDGTCGTEGCIYCSGEGSGEFTASRHLSIKEQFWIQREKMREKWKTERFIAYFQPFTNTYAPIARLRELYEQALSLPQVVGLNIATRADCLPDEVIEYLADLSERTVLTVELGLQSTNDETGERIGRGHRFCVFLDAYRRLREKAPRCRVGVHLMFGLIGENDENMMESVHEVSSLLPDELKIHMLYVLKGTKMGDIYENNGYTPMSMEEYISLVVRALERVPQQVVIGRLTGDPPRNQLLCPLWSLKKGIILNEIDKRFYKENSWQGKFFEKDLGTTLDESAKIC